MSRGHAVDRDKSGNRWHAGRIIYALARHFNWLQNPMMTEYFIDGGQADLVFVTRSRYLTEIEVKVSLSDWKADATKDKWKKPRPNVSRFFYAIPETLADRIPADLPEHAGILVVWEDQSGHERCREKKAARRLKTNKITDKQLSYIYERGHRRFWDREILRLGARLSAQREARA